MEPSFFKEMPKFKSPEEELNYLRAHVKAREEELISVGRIENAGDNPTNIHPKNKQAIDQPIPKDFATMIRSWVAEQEGRLWSRLACQGRFLQTRPNAPSGRGSRAFRCSQG